MCGETEKKSQPPILGKEMLSAYLDSLSMSVLESRKGAQAVSPRINHSPGHIVGPSVIWRRPVTLLLLLPWIQLGWSKSQALGEAGTGGEHWAGLGVLGNTRWEAYSHGVPNKLAGGGPGRCFPHYTLPPPSSCHSQAGRGGQRWPLLPPAWLPVPPHPRPVCLLASAFCPQKTWSPRGLCQASSRCSGSWAPPREHRGHGLGEPQVRGLSSRLTPLPGPGRDGEEVQVHSQRQQQRWCWGGDGRQKEGVGWRVRGWPDSCVPGFRSGLRRVAQSIQGGS